jgi:hypothetical protein
MSALDPTEELARIRRQPAQLLIAIRQEYMIAKGCSPEPTVGDLFDWSLSLVQDRLEGVLGAKVEECNE